jgi:hypothetical protein
MLLYTVSTVRSALLRLLAPRLSHPILTRHSLECGSAVYDICPYVAISCFRTFPARDHLFSVLAPLDHHPRLLTLHHEIMILKQPVAPRGYDECAASTIPCF